jgi:hypothetical protein
MAMDCLRLPDNTPKLSGERVRLIGGEAIAAGSIGDIRALG